MEWSVNHYLPYRRWQTKAKRFDPAVESTIADFSKWYIEKYEAVALDAEWGLVNALTGALSLLRKDRLSLILLVDNLPTTFFPLFQKAMESYGLNAQHVEYRFAPLPTSTEHSKVHLISGNWQDEACRIRVSTLQEMLF